MAQAPEPGDHLVEDEQNAVARADLPQALEIAFRRHQHTGRSRHRLDDYRRDRRRIMQCAQPFELVGEFQTPFRLPAGERISFEVMRVADVVYTRDTGSEHLL